LLHDGGLSDKIINNATGFGFDFTETCVQPKRWHFELKQNRFGLQYYSAGSNHTRFVDTVGGGQIGGTVYQSSGQNEQVISTLAPLP
jgi:hypothetical protein